ncbi:MAG: patatin-like phospholipase family protein [Ignavibacteria bacterium]|nr:patatin-like phospholipase family protein [Ignavibacteria bacterium]
MNALVLSGGSIKGAFEAGAFQAAVEAGFYPDLVCGISVGALNSAFICNEAGKQMSLNKKVVWADVSASLKNIWTEIITSPDMLVEKKNFLQLGWKFLWGNFDGLVSTDPLKKLVAKLLNEEYINQSPVALKVGAVNIFDGKIVFAQKGYPDILQYVLASAAIPIVMPMLKIGSQSYVDGGIKDVAPLNSAIDSGADKILVIACQPEDEGAVDFKPGDIVQLVERVIDIMVGEIVYNDLKNIGRINKIIEDNSGEGSNLQTKYKTIQTALIRPQAPINLNIQTFNQTDLRKLYDIGYQEGQKKMKENPFN